MHSDLIMVQTTNQPTMHDTHICIYIYIPPALWVTGGVEAASIKLPPSVPSPRTSDPTLPNL